MGSNVHFMSNTDQWKTPDHVYSALNDEFGFDPTTRCPLSDDVLLDGLSTEWGGPVL